MIYITPTKYNLGQKFIYSSWNSGDVECRIGRIIISITENGFDIKYGMQFYNKTLDRWDNFYMGHEIYFTEDDKYSPIKEIENKVYTGWMWKMDTGCVEIGDEVTYKVNGCDFGEGAWFAGDIYIVDTIVYEVGYKWSYKDNKEEDYERYSYNYTKPENLKVDSFTAKINNGINCIYRGEHGGASEVYKTELIDWEGEVIPKVIKFFKLNKENPFNKEYPYTVIFRYLGLEDKFKEEWENSKLIVAKKVNKPKKKTKVDEILEGLSNKEKEELIKKLNA